MPSSVSTRELYLAKSFPDLKKKAEIINFGSKDFKRLVFWADKFYLSAKDNLNQGDDERAYCFFYRFMTLLQYVNNNDKEKFLNNVGKRAQEVLEHLDILSERLLKRYEERQKSYEERKAQFFNQVTSSVPGTSVKVNSNDDNSSFDDQNDDNDDDSYKCIDSKQLVQNIQTLSEIHKFLIIDTRSAEDFNESCIAANKFQTTGEVNIINIPNINITPGLTYPILLRKQLNFGLTLDALERRRSMDKVIIMDDQTHHFDKTSKSSILADALWKWDQSPDCIKSKPLLLKGGYFDFVLTYPTLTTKSDVINKYAQLNNTLTTKRNSAETKYFYDFFDEKSNQNDVNIKSMSNQESSENGIQIKDNNLFNNTTSNNNNSNNQKIISSSLTDRKNIFPSISNNSYNNNGKIPGVAKPVIPDRSSKPKNDSLGYNSHKNTNISSLVNENVFNNEINQSKELVKNTNKRPTVDSSVVIEKLPPKPLHLVSTINNDKETKNINGFINQFNKLLDSGDKKMEVDDDDLVAGNFDEENDLRLNSVTSNVLQTPIHKRREVFEVEEDMSDDENVVTFNNESDDESLDHQLSNRSKPILVNRSNSTNQQGFSSSLSRSLSSPNIAQFNQDPKDASFHSAGSGTPKFTQQIPIVDRSVKPLPYQAALRKARDFNPQFSSCARITGLRNLGNTCFMNAILQCLNNTTELTEYLRSGNVHINPNSKFGSNGELTIELMELFKQMVYPSNYKHISPKDLKNAVSRHIPDFVEYKQQDAHEFLVRFLDRVHSDLNQSKPNTLIDPVVNDPNYYDKLSITAAANSFWTLHLKRNKSIITDLFEGLIVSTLTCIHCSYTSKALEAFTCLTLPIQEGGRTSLKNSLNMFLKRERITNEAAWHCPTCKQKRDAEKCTYIWKLPKVLVIHLKRFSYDGMWRQKICTFVDFSLENLTIEARDGEENRFYSLYGVVNHTGSLEGGHYTAYSRNKDLNIGWNKYDDQDVSSITTSDVITQNAYVLFYKAV